MPSSWAAALTLPPALAEASAAWTRRLEAGVGAGARVLVAQPVDDALAALILGALDAGVTLALAAPGGDLPALAEALDAGAVVSAGTIVRRTARLPPDPELRLLLRTSGTVGSGRWIGLSDDNLRAVLDSHRPALDLAGGTVLSVLPWWHVFGLQMELLLTYSSGATLVRDPLGGRDPARLVALAATHRVTHLHAVPLTVLRLTELAEGRALVAGLRGGIVGGAPIMAALAGRLAGTRLRVGYGQTEAAPGITLGEPGDFRPAWLGAPLGCEVRLEPDGELAFRGPNACLGHWEPGTGLVRAPAGAFRRTGDYARAEDGGYVFEGRATASFKLANGRWVEAGRIEQRLAEALGARAALLRTLDGIALELLLTPRDGVSPAQGQLAEVLGSLAAVPLVVRAVPDEAWRRTPKGEIDRRQPLA